MGLVDLVMVRSFGSEATAAIGLIRQLTFVVAGSVLAISTGVIALVSQGIGKGDRDQIDRTASQGLKMALGLGLVTSILGFALARPMMALVRADAGTLEHGLPYLRVYFLGIIFLWINSISAAVFRGAKDAMTPLRLALMVNFINVPVNYVLIHGFGGDGGVGGFGVQGAAMGTAFARALGSVAFVWLLLKETERFRVTLRPWISIDRQAIRRVLAVGLPLAFAAMVRNGARILFLTVIGFSAAGVGLQAAVGVGLQMRLLGVLPALAFQVATATLVGEAIGRRDPREAEKVVAQSSLLLGCIMIVVTLFVMTFALPIARLFITDPEAARLGALVLRWFAVGQVFSALSICVQGALNGAGDTKPVLWYTAISQWGVLLLMSFVFLKIMGWDPVGPLVAWAAAPMLTFSLMLMRWRSGKWKAIRV